MQKSHQSDELIEMVQYTTGTAEYTGNYGAEQRIVSEPKRPEITG
jgi:hypothetical protein